MGDTLDEVRRFITKTMLDLAKADVADGRQVLARSTIQEAKNVLRRTR